VDLKYGILRLITPAKRFTVVPLHILWLYGAAVRYCSAVLLCFSVLFEGSKVDCLIVVCG